MENLVFTLSYNAVGFAESLGFASNMVTSSVSMTNSTLNLAPGSVTVGIQEGMYVSSSNIPQVAVIQSIVPNVSIQLSMAPQLSGTGFVTFAPIANAAQTQSPLSSITGGLANIFTPAAAAYLYS